MTKYRELLRIIIDGGFQTFRMREFAELETCSHIAIGCRRDVNHDLELARKMALLEAEVGIHSTYFILHTAPYYKDKKSLLNSCKVIQSLGHEIGFHSNMVSAQVFDGLKLPGEWLAKELRWFKDNGINITGVSQHGDKRCREFYFLNDYFWQDCPMIPDHFGSYYSVGDDCKIIKAKEEWFGFEYNCSKLNITGYRSDAQFKDIYPNIWFAKFSDFSEYKNGDKVELLVHPCRWENA